MPFHYLNPTYGKLKKTGISLAYWLELWTVLSSMQMLYCCIEQLKSHNRLLACQQQRNDCLLCFCFFFSILLMTNFQTLKKKKRQRRTFSCLSLYLHLEPSKSSKKFKAPVISVSSLQSLLTWLQQFLIIVVTVKKRFLLIVSWSANSCIHESQQKEGKEIKKNQREHFTSFSLYFQRYLDERRIDVSSGIGMNVELMSPVVCTVYNDSY